MAFYYAVSPNMSFSDTRENSIEDMFDKIEEMHFVKMPITYSIDVDSSHYSEGKYVQGLGDEIEVERIKEAFRIIEESSNNLIKFKEINGSEKPNLIIKGLPSNKNADEDSLETLGDALITKFGEDNQILEAEINFYAQESGFWAGNTETFSYGGYEYNFNFGYEYVPTITWNTGMCREFPLVEVHEILHALGFNHLYDSSSLIMYPIQFDIQSCQIKEIDRETKSCLNHIYSNGEIVGNCSGLNSLPYEKEEPDTNRSNFKWDRLPVTYSVNGCIDVQKKRIEMGIDFIQRALNKQGNIPFTKMFEYKSNGSAQVNFICDKRGYYSARLSDETDFWDSGIYFPASQPEFIFENEKIKEVNITLFAEDHECGGLEVHSLLHGLGLRQHDGIWMKSEHSLCTASNVYIIDSESINKLKELYFP